MEWLFWSLTWCMIWWNGSVWHQSFFNSSLLVIVATFLLPRIKRSLGRDDLRPLLPNEVMLLLLRVTVIFANLLSSRLLNSISTTWHVWVIVRPSVWLKLSAVCVMKSGSCDYIIAINHEHAKHTTTVITVTVQWIPATTTVNIRDYRLKYTLCWISQKWLQNNDRLAFLK